jgi:hypothetical protein
VPSFAALGVIVIPRLSRDYDPKNLTSLVALWLFSVFAIALSSSRRITCASSLDAWGRTVLRRTTMAIWYIWTALLLAHVWFWATEFDLNLFVLVPVALLLRTRVARSERETWASVAGALAVGALLPTYFSMFAGMACIALVLSILRQPSPAPIEALVPNDAPDLDSREEDVAVFSSFVVAQPAARARFFAGSIFAVYLCWWTRPWTGGALPAHALVLDLSLTTALLFMFWKTRRVAPLTALFAAYLHLGVATGVIFVPRTQMHWAIVYLGLGFGLLLTSLVASLWFLRTDSTADNSGVSND